MPVINIICRGVLKMKVFNCIFGVFAIIGGIYSICFPVASFLNAEVIAIILLGVWGICAIFNYATKQKTEESKTADTIGLISGIIAIVFCLFAMFVPMINLVVDIVVAYIFAFWLIISGVSTVAVAVKQKGNGGKMWILSLVLGILVGLAGVYGVFHAIVMLATMGTFLAFLLIIYGFRLICSVFEQN